MLEYKIQKSWEMVGKVRIIDMSNGYFCCNSHWWRITIMLCLSVVDDGGSLYHSATLKTCFLGKYEDSECVVWVCFLCLAMELYHEKFLRRAGYWLGSFLKIDNLTSIHSCGKFARLLC